jgi:hypothetical protein
LASLAVFYVHNIDILYGRSSSGFWSWNEFSPYPSRASWRSDGQTTVDTKQGGFMVATEVETPPVKQINQDCGRLGRGRVVDGVSLFPSPGASEVALTEEIADIDG